MKALHVYDRLGLLKPGRTAAGHRRYKDVDLERVEQIVALRFLGLPLKQIREVLDSSALELPEALRLQRRALEAKQAVLRRAIRAIEAAEQAMQVGKPTGPDILRKIIEVIDMQNGIEAMKKYYTTEAAWERRQRYYEEGPAPEWLQLFQEAGAMLGEDPASERAQELLERWSKLWERAYRGDPTVQIDSPTAWMDWENWPAAVKARFAPFPLAEIHVFIRKAAISSTEKYYSAGGWPRVVELRKSTPPEFWQERVDLFREIEAAATGDPFEASTQALIARWYDQLERASGGDDKLKEGFLRMWVDRHNWSDAVRKLQEAAYMMCYERFLAVADFIDMARSLENTQAAPSAP